MVAEGSSIEFKYQDKVTIRIISDPRNLNRPIEILVTKHDTCKQFVKIGINKESKGKIDQPAASSSIQQKLARRTKDKSVQTEPVSYGHSPPNWICFEKKY